MSDTVMVTCHTEGCGNEGHAIELPAGSDMDGEWTPTTAFACGVCGQAITDVNPGIPQDE